MNARSYNLLDRETLLELEEIAPHDYFFVSEDFDKAALAFFEEADFEDAFNPDFCKMQPSQVTITIERICKRCAVECSHIDLLIREYGEEAQRLGGGEAKYTQTFKNYLKEMLDNYVGKDCFNSLQNRS